MKYYRLSLVSQPQHWENFSGATVALYLPVYTDKKTGQQKQSAVSVNRSASRPVMATRARLCKDLGRGAADAA